MQTYKTPAASTSQSTTVKSTMHPQQSYPFWRRRDDGSVLYTSSGLDESSDADHPFSQGWSRSPVDVFNTPDDSYGDRLQESVHWTLCFDHATDDVFSRSSRHLFLAAMIAGGLGGMAGNPADILLVRMTSDSVRPPEERYNYRNALSGLVTLIKDEGVHGLFRGMGTNLTRAILMNGSQVGSYDLFKQILLRNKLPLIDYQLQDGLLLHSISSVLAGTFATTVTAPADVMRSRLMAAHGNTHPVEVLTTALREEGPRFLFKGWTPAFIRLGPNTVLMFIFFEQLKKGWRAIFPADYVL